MMIDGNDNMWSAILKTASLSKRIHTKNVLLLGDSCSGKSTLAHYLKHQPNIEVDYKNEHSDNEPSQQHKEACFIRTVASGGYVKAVKQDLDPEATKMLGVGYTSALVHNQNNEAILRLGIYQLDNKQLFSLLDPVLTDDNLFGIIVLDWTKPWTFLESLELWLSVLKRWSTKVVTNESKARVEEYMREYKCQLSGNSTNNSDHEVVAEEVHGTFTVNLGIPIAVVCCKSDAQKMLEEEYGYDEAQLDYIQQTLRCICMKYGAALFYTSTFHPSTFNNLREYIAHRSDSTIPSTFQPQHVESTRVLIPAGWDTLEKIKALEENSQCKVEKEWNDIIQNQPGDGITTGLSIYREAIPEPGYENQCQGSHPTVTSEDEQVLYARYFQQSSVVQPPLPPPLSTTFLRELEYCKASISISPPKDTHKKYTSLPLLPTTHHIETATATAATTGAISPPAVSLYTTSTTAITSVNTISSSLSTTANSRNNINLTSMTAGFSSTTNTSSTYNNKIGVTASPSSEILSQFFQKLLYKNVEQTPSSTGNGDSDGAAKDSISHSSTVDSSMHNSRPPCVNTT